MEKIKLIGRYVGPARIVNIREIERKTFLGRDIVELEFEDKSKKEYPLEDLEIIATEKVGDLTALRALEITPITKKILGILADSELPIYNPVGANIQYLLQTVLPESILESTRIAYGMLFDKNYYELTLADMDRVLQKYGKARKEEFPKKEENGIIK